MYLQEHGHANVPGRGVTVPLVMGLCRHHRLIMSAGTSASDAADAVQAAAPDAQTAAASPGDEL